MRREAGFGGGIEIDAALVDQEQKEQQSWNADSELLMRGEVASEPRALSLRSLRCVWLVWSRDACA